MNNAALIGPRAKDLHRIAQLCASIGMLGPGASSINARSFRVGRTLTGFTNGQEEAVNLTHVVPFLVEDELKRIGGIYEKAPDWQPFALVDGRVVTGQNPASSTSAAQALLKLLVPKAA